MADEEEESMSEGFSASEEEWKPGKDVRGGESSDDDDSDFEDLPLVGSGGNIGGGASTCVAASKKKGEPKSRSASKSASTKKRKPIGQSLRAKLYNKYRPPPKTLTSPSRCGGVGSNSPSASTSRTASKNAKTPNESSELHDNDNSSSDSSVEDYLVNPAELDLRSSFFNVDGDRSSAAISKETSPAPIFDCNAGLTNLSDSGSEDNNESSAEEQNTADTKAFDFRNLLEKANSLERAKVTIAKRAAEAKTQANNSSKNCSTTMDVNSLLALGENQNHSADVLVMKEKAEEDERNVSCIERGSQKLNKTKSTRTKRHTKTRPASTVVAGDTDNSDWEDVADGANDSRQMDNNATHNDNLEIHVELPSRHRKKDNKKQQDLEMAIKRKLNRDLKERQMLLHQTSLLCHFGRSYFYNRLLNDTQLMQASLKLLPSKNVYPPERGTEIKYFQSLVTWFKTAIKLLSPNLYPEKTVHKKKSLVKGELLEQIRLKEARCKQDMIFIFVILMRAMGLQCRLVVNMQPLPLKPAQSDLLTIHLKSSDQAKEANAEKTKIENTDKVKEQKEKVEVEVEKSKINKDGASTGKNLKKEQNKEEILGSKINVNEKGSELTGKGKPEEETRENIAKKTMKSSNEEMGKIKLKVQNTHKCFEVNSEEDKQSSTREKSTQKRRLAANMLPKDTELNEEGSNVDPKTKISLSKLKRGQTEDCRTVASKKQLKLIKQPSLSVEFTPVAMRTRHASSDEIPSSSNIVQRNNRPVIEVGSKIVIQRGKNVKNNFAAVAASSSVDNENKFINVPRDTRSRSRSKSPKVHVSPTFLQTETYKQKFPVELITTNKQTKEKHINEKSSSSNTLKISTAFLHKSSATTTKATAATTSRVLRSRQTKSNEKTPKLNIPLLDGADDIPERNVDKSKRRPHLKKLRKPSSHSKEDSDEDFEPSPPKKPKQAPLLPKDKNLATKNRKVLSSDDNSGGDKKPRNKATAGDMWIELWSDVEEEWICVELFQGKLHSVEAIRKSASSSLAYVFAFQNDCTLKDITARYCPHWANTVRKLRVDKAWLETAISNYHGHRTARDIHEDQELRRIHEKKPMPTAIGEYKNHPLYALERHLLQYQALYPPDAPTLGFVRGEPVYPRDCVHTLYSRETWLKSARTVKLGEQPYKIVLRPKWDSKSASSNLAYVFAFQNDLSLKDVTARYCPHWAITVRKSRVDKAWLDTAISNYIGHRTRRDIHEDLELRRIHEEKPMPTAICDFKNHPLYVLERHLLKFQAIYPSNAPTLGFVRGEPVYSRDCVHMLHSREIWLKSARTVKLGEQPYKIVKARPKWDRLTQTVIKDQPLEIFGYWQTQDYEPPTAENGIVPRNAYGNVELFKECMLPKKTVHLKLSGLNRICKKLNIDCANAVIGFDFHQGVCHPMFDGFVVCEEFGDQVTAAWYQDQEEQACKEQEKYEARVFGNWKKLIRGVLIRERLKKKYNF